MSDQREAVEDVYGLITGQHSQSLSATMPLIELTATPEHLGFRARFGLGQFMGPWRLERAQVTAVFRAPGIMSDCIAIQGDHYLDWSIYAFSLEPILLSLEELGYPVDWLRRR